ncbi:MAG TPA: glycosyltransferase [Dissulfurispiraceae bacterium]
MKVLHIIVDLSTGGAEMMLYKLLSSMDRTAFEQEVVSLTDIGEVGEKIRKLDIPVHALGMRKQMPNPLLVLKLSRWIRRRRPDMIQTWMYHADLVGGLAAKMSGGVPVVWGIRHTNLDPAYNRRMTLRVARLCASLSERLPARIVCCSEAARLTHEAIGYVPGKITVIPNGFNSQTFKPDPSARLSVRKELGLAGDVLLIGLVARFNPQKDHLTFVRAAALLHERLPEVHFVLCGDGITAENPELKEWIEDAGIRRVCHLLGKRTDIPRLTASFDIAASSSCGEGFPNAVGEAMACGIPCVVTDAGDSAFLVGDTGRVVRPMDSPGLAAAWMEVISLGRDERFRLGLSARRRVEEHFSLPAVAARYETLYETVASCAA